MTHRVITDPGGRTWHIWQVEPLEWDEPPVADAPDVEPHATPTSLAAYLDPALSKGWLCFESQTERRRLAPIPAGWDRMAESELRALCAWATTVPRTYGGVMLPPRRDSYTPEDGSTDSIEK